MGIRRRCRNYTTILTIRIYCYALGYALNCRHYDTRSKICHVAPRTFPASSGVCYAGVLAASIIAWNNYEDSKSKLDAVADKYDAATTSPSELKDGVIASVVSVLSVLFYFFVLHAHDLPHLMNQHRQHMRTQWFFMNGPLKH